MGYFASHPNASQLRTVNAKIPVDKRALFPLRRFMPKTFNPRVSAPKRICGRRRPFNSILVFASVLMAISPACGAPLFLDVSARGGSTEPLRVFPKKAVFTFTLSAANPVEPQLRADLFAAAQSIAAPIATDLKLELRREGANVAGIQRFQFSLDLPTVSHRQKFVLRLRVRAVETEPWLPLPVVVLEACPETWPVSLRSFTERIPSGCFAAHEKLSEILKKAGSSLKISTTTSAIEERVQVWLSEEEPDQAAPDSAKAVWVIFKPDVPGRFAVQRRGSRQLVVLVDAAILTTLETDPASQEILEHALTAAEALLPLPVFRP
jgi:hypothetical protein